MPELSLDPEEFQKTSREFHDAAKQIAEIGARLDERIETLANTWEQSSEHELIKIYKEWRVQIGEFATNLDKIAEQFEAVTESLYKADN